MDGNTSLVPKDASEDQVIDLWIKGKNSEHTRRAYRRHIDHFRTFVCKPIPQVTLIDMYDFSEHLKEEGLGPNSCKVIMDIVKAFFDFTYRAGLLRVNVGAAFKALPREETMSERILSEYEVQSMILNEPNTRNAILMRVLYDGALRVSELCGLRWKNVVERGDEVQVAVLGKGNKKRHVLLSRKTSDALHSLGRGEDEEYVFLSDEEHRDKNLSERQVQNIVKHAAKRAGIKRWADVSPHWLRHSHATHAIERDAPLPLVRDTLGHSNISITNTYAHVRPNESSSKFLPSF